MAELDRFKGMTCFEFLESIHGEAWNWVAKRLSGNDTGLTGGHQSGLYLPRLFFEMATPQITTTTRLNPDAWFECLQLPDRCESKVRAIYYNNRYFESNEKKRGTRDEFRLTRWGRGSGILNKENTGAIVLLFWRGDRMVTWLSQNEQEEEILQDFVGNEIEPGQFHFSSQFTPAGLPKAPLLLNKIILPTWLEQFPNSRTLAETAISRIAANFKVSPDEILVARRDLETQLFYELERQHVEPILKRGFASVDEFVSSANSVTNRRKSRSGRSLELHLAAIFEEHGIQFEEQAQTELRKKPDFLFPSEAAYRQNQPQSRLFMMAAKTCCKDRWRQVLSEADRIPEKHLFTLQEGVSENQIREMLDQRVRLVVPECNRKRFPASVRDELLSLQQFIKLVADAQTQT